MQGSLQEIVTQVKLGQLKPTQLVADALRQAEAKEELNIFTEIFRSTALQAAQDLEKRLTSAQAVGRLAGVVFCVKDNFLYRGSKTTAAAPFLQDFIAPYTATCLSKLLDEDAILIGKTNLDAFAHGTSTENSYFGPSRNPCDASLTPGGSSGGSAAAVAADICSFSLGTDTGGSVRLPAGFCGVFGFKPTYGLLSRSGIVAMASSTDCVAPLSRSPQEAAYLIDILKGKDEADGTTFESDNLHMEEVVFKAPLKVGLIEEFSNNLSAPVGAAFEEASRSLSENGWQVEKVSLPSVKFALACYYILVSAEISSNLSRYDGLQYGLSQASSDWSEAINLNRSSGFMAENKRRIMLGTYVLSQGYYEAYYHKAQKLRTLLCREFEQAFQKYDVLLSPVSPSLPFKLGEKITNPVEMYLADLMTVAPSLVGIPAASLPLPSPSLPIGLQIMTPQKTDAFNLKIAEEIAKLL